MLAAIAHYTATDQWPIGTTPERMRYRRTDWFVHDTIKAERQQSVWPLSVSSDRIAVCAWRCARLLTSHAERTGRQLDRIGAPHVGGVDQPAAPRLRRLLTDAGVSQQESPIGRDGLHVRTVGELREALFAWTAVARARCSGCGCISSELVQLSSRLVTRFLSVAELGSRASARLDYVSSRFGAEPVQ
jgi:hypothetical protein